MKLNESLVEIRRALELDPQDMAAKFGLGERTSKAPFGG